MTFTGTPQHPRGITPDPANVAGSATSVRVMDRGALAAQLAEGRSIEAIARDCGRAASTAAYWVNKYGLASWHAPRHATRGGIERERLQAFVEEGLSIRQIAA